MELKEALELRKARSHKYIRKEGKKYIYKEGTGKTNEKKTASDVMADWENKIREEGLDKPMKNQHSPSKSQREKNKRLWERIKKREGKKKIMKGAIPPLTKIMTGLDSEIKGGMKVDKNKVKSNLNKMSISEIREIRDILGEGEIDPALVFSIIEDGGNSSDIYRFHNEQNDFEEDPE